MKQLPNRPLVTGKGVASAVDLGDADKADRRNPKCPSEKAANIQNGGANPVDAPLSLRDRAWPTPTPQEQSEDAEQRAHDDGECEGIPFCPYCLDAWEEANQEALDYGK